MLLYTLSKTALTCSSVKQAVGVLVDVGLAVVVLGELSVQVASVLRAAAAVAS